MRIDPAAIGGPFAIFHSLHVFCRLSLVVDILGRWEGSPSHIPPLPFLPPHRSPLLLHPMTDEMTPPEKWGICFLKKLF